MFIHATSVALRASPRQPWRAVLLRGASGAGKSDLALRLIQAGGRLIADDQTHLAIEGRALIASSPASIAGRIEVRGLGIVELPRGRLLARAPVALLVDLVPAEKIERLPERAQEMQQGVALPVVALAPFEASAVAKLLLAFNRIRAA
ncbi:MAG TPA: HPr kinase/phosphatase C-terminal domain-containing protein [Reyranella sp.]|nr:HPr kinase/phosphatase C-terminal domain-containing protein [Reyranella sp.]